MSGNNGFWDKKPKSPVEIAAAQAEAFEQSPVLDEQAVAVLQGDALDEFDLFDDEEEDLQSLMLDANLRLEMGRLYQMVLQGNIFADTNADPKAIRIVERVIRKCAVEHMELMLGIRQEQVAAQPIVSSPFNDLEVTVLKMLASKMSKGATETSSAPAPAPVQPKKDGITSISGNLRPNAPLAPAGKKPVNQPHPSKPRPAVKSAIAKDESFLKKPINEMTQEELAAHNAAAEERSKRNYAAMPQNLVPHPNPQQLEMLYTQSAAQMSIANPWRSNGTN
jgi:hypothetical protein